MLEPNTVACRVNPLKTEKTSPFPKEAFERFSKTELLAVVRVMHRILDADRRRDLERIVTELPTLFPHPTGPREVETDVEEHASPFEVPSFKDEHTYRLFHYVFSCLSKAQAKMDTTKTGQFRVNKDRCRLSPRELTVLLWMKEGKTNWEIARILGLSERTVRFHAGSIFEKLDVTSRTQAVARALGTGLIAS